MANLAMKIWNFQFFWNNLKILTCRLPFDIHVERLSDLRSMWEAKDNPVHAADCKVWKSEKPGWKTGVRVIKELNRVQLRFFRVVKLINLKRVKITKWRLIFTRFVVFFTQNVLFFVQLFEGVQFQSFTCKESIKFNSLFLWCVSIVYSLFSPLFSVQSCFLHWIFLCPLLSCFHFPSNFYIIWQKQIDLSQI